MRTIKPPARREDTRQTRGKASRALVIVAMAAGLFGAGAAPTLAATSHQAVHSTAAPAPASKAASAPPAGIAVGKSIATGSKPRATKGVVRPMTLSVTLTASSTMLWPTRYTTLTATANQDLGSTPYDLFIYDDLGNDVVCQIITATTCQVAETEPTPGYDDYFAYIAPATDTNGTNAVAYSQTVAVEWEGITLTLSASAHTVPVGTAVTLSATSNTDIGPSPFYIQIWDTTTGTLLNTGYCGTGTVCPEAGQASIVVSQSVATTHSYIATFAMNGSTYPPAELQTTSAANYVTWTGDGYQISLSAPAVVTNGPTPVTVKTNIDIGPTPYCVEVYDETTGNRIAGYGSGSAWTFDYQVGRDQTDYLVAFISACTTTLPPGSIQASSSTVSVTEYYIG
jgi:hypothetical protein